MSAHPPAYIVEPNSTTLINGYATAFSWLCAYFFYTRFFLEIVLPKVYPKIWASMDIKDRRSFTVHHHWLTVKGLALPGVWPYVNIMFRGKQIYEPLYPGASISNGDWLGVLFMAIIASFVWELAYRCKISPVSLLHHVAAICLASWQISGEVHAIPYTSTPPGPNGFIGDEQNAQQFKLIMTYGVFEVVFESWMHFCCIFHKKLQGNYKATSRLWGAGATWVLAGSLAELAVMAVLWAQFWSSWETGMRVAMIFLHFAFMAAQLHGARVGYSLMRKYRAKAIKERKGIVDDELPSQTVATLPTLAHTDSSEAITPMHEKKAELGV